MAAPINTYNSLTDLGLGQVPPVDDPLLYRELLDIHNAIETLLTSSDDGDSAITEYITKQRNVTTHTVDAVVSELEGTLLIDASSNPVTLTLLSAAAFLGYAFTFKCIDDTFKADVIATPPDMLEEEVTSFELFKGEYIEVRSDGTNWRIT